MCMRRMSSGRIRYVQKLNPYPFTIHTYLFMRAHASVTGRHGRRHFPHAQKFQKLADKEKGAPSCF